MSRPTWPGYAVGAGIVLAISLGAALIVYGLGYLAFQLSHVLVWLFGPLGLYTLAYGLARRAEAAYYVFWGIIMIFVALTVPASALGWPLLPLIGILILVIAVVATVAYSAGRRGH